MNLLHCWLIRQASRGARPFLRYFGLCKTVKIFNKSTVVWEPKGRTILVLAPHMDDEVIGCGGTLYKHARSGAQVIVVYMTDGRYGSRTLQHFGGEERSRREKELVDIRKQEARLAMNTLGVTDGIFLDCEETKLVSSPPVQHKLREIIQAIHPDIVYLPFFLEQHPDHRITSQILVDATEGRDFHFDCYGYEVWTPLVPNCLVDISEVVNIKQRALEHYQSQLADKDYIHTTLGLNAYRSSALLYNQSRFAEAFFLSPLQIYRDLFRDFVTCVQDKLSDAR